MACPYQENKMSSFYWKQNDVSISSKQNGVSISFSSKQNGVSISSKQNGVSNSVNKMACPSQLNKMACPSRVNKMACLSLYPVNKMAYFSIKQKEAFKLNNLNQNISVKRRFVILCLIFIYFFYIFNSKQILIIYQGSQFQRDLGQRVQDREEQHAAPRTRFRNMFCWLEQEGVCLPLHGPATGDLPARAHR